MSNDTVKARPISRIAREIVEVWKAPNYGAAPYIEALLTLDKIEQNFWLDSGEEIVLRFLGNASGWRGEDARRIKAELKSAVSNMDKTLARENMNAAYRQ